MAGSLARLTRLGGACLPPALLALACSNVLGIEKVHEGPNPADNLGAAGDGGSGGDATTSSGGTKNQTSSSAGGGSGGQGEGGEGNSSGGSGSNTGGSGGSGGEPGSGGSDGGTGGSGGDLGSGGSGGGSGGSGGSVGSGGSGGATSPTVHGRVVNHWLQPVPNVQVMIGEDLELSDSNGEFEFADVPEQYDVMMAVTYKRYGNDASYGWVYEGLARRDPTLQVYGGLQLVSGNLEYSPTNVSDASNRVLLTALGGEYGAWQRDGTNAVSTSASWYGPDSVTMNAHGVLFSETDGLPSAYHAYDFLADIEFPGTTDPAIVSLDMTDETLTTGTITGTVTSPSTSDRENRVFVRFSDNAALEVVDHYGGTLTDDFEYLVPTLPDATLTVSAHEGVAYFGAAAVAFETGVQPGDDVDLVIPTPPTLNSPPNGTTLDPNTTFGWIGPSDTYVWHVESTNWYEGIYVVTTRNQIEMPVFPNGFALRPDEPHYWRVESLGDASSVDELAGPDGFKNEFSPSEGDGVTGPERTSGTFSISSSRSFTTAP